MYSKILKKSKKEIEAPEAKPMHIGKKAAEHVMDSMEPESEDEMEMPSKKGMMPEAKIEIELILNSAKKKK
jgi:hypothetical protein